MYAIIINKYIYKSIYVIQIAYDTVIHETIEIHHVLITIITLVSSLINQHAP